MKVWRMIAHHEKPELAIRLAQKEGKLRMGWGRIGDLSKRQILVPNDITRLIQEYYPDSTNFAHGGASLYGFAKDMEIGDLVIVSTGRRRDAVMEVTGDYHWNPRGHSQLGDYQHERKARMTSHDAEDLWRQAGMRAAFGFNIRWTLVRCTPMLHGEFKI